MVDKKALRCNGRLDIVRQDTALISNCLCANLHNNINNSLWQLDKINYRRYNLHSQPHYCKFAYENHQQIRREQPARYANRTWSLPAVIRFPSKHTRKINGYPEAIAKKPKSLLASK
jgi:hypothetical protein